MIFLEKNKDIFILKSVLKFLCIYQVVIFIFLCQLRIIVCCSKVIYVAILFHNLSSSVSTHKEQLCGF
jgi:hypothetical protein